MSNSVYANVLGVVMHNCVQSGSVEEVMFGWYARYSRCGNLETSGSGSERRLGMVFGCG